MIRYIIKWKLLHWDKKIQDQLNKAYTAIKEMQTTRLKNGLKSTIWMMPTTSVPKVDIREARGKKLLNSKSYLSRRHTVMRDWAPKTQEVLKICTYNKSISSWCSQWLYELNLSRIKTLWINADHRKRVNRTSIKALINRLNISSL